MVLSQAERTSFTGAYWALSAVFMFSLNDVVIKFLSGDYPLYQVMFVRSLVGLACVLAFTNLGNAIAGAINAIIGVLNP